MSKNKAPAKANADLSTARSDVEVRTLDGKWSMRDWRHDNEESDKKETATADAEIFQESDSNSVRGRFRSRDTEYTFSGYLKQGIVLTSTWESNLEGVGGKWHGTFQFKVLDHGDRMLGLWIGINTNVDRINWGTWEWKRLGVETYPSDMKNHASLLPPTKIWPGWGHLPIASKAALIVAMITACGGIIAAIIKILPFLL